MGPNDSESYSDTFRELKLLAENWEFAGQSVHVLHSRINLGIRDLDLGKKLIGEHLC